MSQVPVKLAKFSEYTKDTAGLGLMLDRQFEELVAYAQHTAETLPSNAITAPTTISSLTTTGGFGHVRLEYAFNNYSGHKHTQVWASEDTDFANAVHVGDSAAKFYQHFPNSPSISQAFYYWVRNENLDGDEGDLYGPVAGSVGSDPNYDLEILLEQLGFGHFQSGTYPIRTEATFPTLPATNYPVGCIIYLTTNQLLYKNVNEAWEPVLAAEDMIGEITGTQIADGSISTPKLQALSVTANEMASNSVIAGKIAAGALVVDDGVMQNGYIKNAHITDCSAAKIIAGIITAGDIYLGADSQIHLDGANQQIAVNDGTYDRVVIGKLDATSWGLIVRDASGNTVINGSGELSASAIAGLGDLATVDGFTLANIDTYFETAAIGEGLIANAAVSTLKIQDNAVTVPVAAANSAQMTIGSSYTTLLSASIDSEGQPVNVIFNAHFQVEGNSVHPSNTIFARILVDGSAVESGIRVLATRDDGAYEEEGLLTLVRRLSLATGSHTITIQAYRTMSYSYTLAYAAHRNLLLQGIKR